MTETANEPVYFWQETHSELGYLSQWYYCPFRDDKDPSIVYKTAEHYMMYHKAVVFKDPTSALEVLKASSPRKAKALGRKVDNFDSKKWDKLREEVVYKGNILKFTNAITEEGYRKGSESSSGPLEGSLKDMLLATGDRELVEASPFDMIWGVGFAAANADDNRASWGLNLLGNVLTKVRAELREQGDKAAEDEEA